MSPPLGTPGPAVPAACPQRPPCQCAARSRMHGTASRRMGGASNVLLSIAQANDGPSSECRPILHRHAARSSGPACQGSQAAAIRLAEFARERAEVDAWLIDFCEILTAQELSRKISIPWPDRTLIGDCCRYAPSCLPAWSTPPRAYSCNAGWDEHSPAPDRRIHLDRQWRGARRGSRSAGLDRGSARRNRAFRRKLGNHGSHRAHRLRSRDLAAAHAGAQFRR